MRKSTHILRGKQRPMFSSEHLLADSSHVQGYIYNLHLAADTWAKLLGSVLEV